MAKNLHDNICDEIRFNALFKKHAKDLSNFLYYKFGDHLNPKDKTQDAFIKLWENCKKVTPEKAKSFLFTIANNLMLNEVKHHKIASDMVDRLGGKVPSGHLSLYSGHLYHLVPIAGLSCCPYIHSIAH